MIPEYSRVWALAAVSSKKQDMIDQHRWVNEIVPQRSLILGRTFAGKASGRDGLRKIVNDMMEALHDLKATCPEEMPRYLLMIRPDRIGRGDVLAVWSCINELFNLGVTIWTRDGGELAFETLEQQLVACIHAFLGAMDNRYRATRIKAAYEREGAIRGHRRPYGIKLGRNSDGALIDVPDDDRGKVVSLAFAMRRDGHTISEIGRMLDASAPPAKTAEKEYEVEWLDGRVTSMLKNQAYAHCGVTDDVTFTMANARRPSTLQVQRSHKTCKFPLAGAIVCYCGRGLVTGVSNGKDRYYKCVAYSPHPNNKTRNIRADALEKQFVAVLQSLTATPELLLLAQDVEPSAPLPQLKSEIGRYEIELRKLQKDSGMVWQLFKSGKVAGEYVNPEMEAIKKEKLDIQARVSEAREKLQIADALAQRKFDVHDLVSRAAEIFTDVDASEASQRRVSRLVADEVGLCVEADGNLSLRHVQTEAAGRRRKRK